jgi:hypothetical protein
MISVREGVMEIRNVFERKDRVQEFERIEAAGFPSFFITQKTLYVYQYPESLVCGTGCRDFRRSATYGGIPRHREEDLPAG